MLTNAEVILHHSDFFLMNNHSLGTNLHGLLWEMTLDFFVLLFVVYSYLTTVKLTNYNTSLTHLIGYSSEKNLSDLSVSFI